MSFVSWFRNAITRPATRTIRKGPQRARLTVEALEDRCLLSGNPTISTFASGLSGPVDQAFDSAGNVYIANSSNNTVSKYDASGHLLNASIAAGLVVPWGLAFDASGNLYIANHEGPDSIIKVTPGGSASTFVSSGLSRPTALEFDSSGDLFVANNGNGTISKVTPAGVVSTFASGIPNPSDMSFDSSGNLYVSANTGGEIDKITPGGVVSTFVSGLSSPDGVAVDSSGNVYFTSRDAGNPIWKATPTGSVSTYATGFSAPEGLTFDSSGNLYLADVGTGDVGTGSVFKLTNATLLHASASSQGTINIGSNGSVDLHLAIAAGQLSGTDTVASLFNGVTFTIAIQNANGSATYGTLTSTAKVDGNGYITVSMNMNDALKADLYEAYASGEPVNFNITATANGGNYVLDDDTMSRLLNNGAFKYVP